MERNTQTMGAMRAMPLIATLLLHPYSAQAQLTDYEKSFESMMEGHDSTAYLFSNVVDVDTTSNLQFNTYVDNSNLTFNWKTQPGQMYFGKSFDLTASGFYDPRVQLTTFAVDFTWNSQPGHIDGVMNWNPGYVTIVDEIKLKWGEDWWILEKNSDFTKDEDGINSTYKGKVHKQGINQSKDASGKDHKAGLFWAIDTMDVAQATSTTGNSLADGNGTSSTTFSIVPEPFAFLTFATVIALVTRRKKS